MIASKSAPPKRVLFRLRTIFKFRYHRDNSPFVGALVRDISTGGLMMQAPETMTPGTKVIVELRLPGTFSKIHLKAEAARQVVLGKSYLTALKFIQPPTQAIDEIVRFIDRKSNIFLDQLALLTFAFVAFFAMAVRLADMAVISWFLGTPFGRQWVDAAFFGSMDSSVYVMANLFLALGILLFSAMLFFYQLWARFPLLFFYGVGFLWQCHRILSRDWSRMNDPIFWLISAAEIGFALLYAIFIFDVWNPDFYERFKGVLALRNFDEEEKIAQNRVTG